MHKEAQLFFCVKGEGFMLKVARLWQVIVLAMSICEVKIACRPCADPYDANANESIPWIAKNPSSTQF
jgi:hypothetical protein